MKALLTRYARYNTWANERLVETMLPLNNEQHHREVPGSFNSLYKTVFHMWDVESGWWQRMRLHDNILYPSKTFSPTFKDACNGWLQTSKLWEDYLSQPFVNEDALESDLHYKSREGKPIVQKVADVIQHVFNHSTYHRGQLIAMLHAIDVQPLPITDYIYYCMTKEPVQ